MDTNLGIKIHNRFDVVLTDAKTGEVKQTAKAENLVCNTFLPYCVMGQVIISSNRYMTGMQSIVLGTGTGTPAVTDTQLFSQLCVYQGVPTRPGWTKTRIDATTCSYTASVTADENTANGDLTEIGLGESHVYYSDTFGWDTAICGIYTHALFTDGEGNPIIIKKTNADKLTITATIYSTVTTNNTNNSVYVFTNYRNVDSSVIACDPRLPYVQGDGFYSSYNGCVLGSLYEALASSIRMYPMTLPIYNANAILSYTASLSKTISTYTARSTATGRILADTDNYKYPSTVMIKSFTCGSVMVTLPNENVFPARQYTLTAIADGNSDSFNFGIPTLNTDNVEVYVDGVLQDSNSYTFNGIDYTHIQGWESFDSLYLDSFDLTKVTFNSGSYASYHRTAWPVFNGSTDYYSSTVADTETGIYIYDFKTNYTVTAVGKYLPTGALTNYNSTRFVPRLYYSNDKSNWTQVTGLWSTVTDYINAPNISTVNGYISIAPIVARYWKVENPVIRIPSNVTTTDSNQLCCSIVFGNPKPQLKLNTVPPADAEVKIKAYCSYPIKNSNWIIEPGMTFDVTVGLAT